MLLRRGREGRGRNQRPDGKQVVVFGVSSRVIYVEAFDVATGAVMMSFRAYN